MLIDRWIKKPQKNKGESTVRSILKTLSWRFLGTIDTIIISYLITGNISSAFSIGSVELFSKMILYYLHERAWTKIKIQ